MRLRKELSRKRIDGSMPFKPKINSLSKKIVEGKRKSVAHIVNTDSEKEATISQNGSYQKPSEPTIKYYV